MLSNLGRNFRYRTTMLIGADRKGLPIIGELAGKGF